MATFSNDHSVRGFSIQTAQASVPPIEAFRFVHPAPTLSTLTASTPSDDTPGCFECVRQAIKHFFIQILSCCFGHSDDTQPPSMKTEEAMPLALPPDTSKQKHIEPRQLVPIYPGLFQTKNVPDLVLSFIGPKELARSAVVSRVWRECVNSGDLWLKQCHTLIPGFVRLYPTVSDKETLRIWYPRVFGREFYLDYFGVDLGTLPSVPRKLLEQADQITYIPTHLPLEIIEDSPLGLDVNGMLTSNRSKYALPPSEYARPAAVEGKRLLQIPVTLNNMGIFVQTLLKKGKPTGFRETAEKRIFEQHGNTRVQSSGWVGQKEGPTGAGMPYLEQRAFAENAGFEVVSLIERVFFNFLPYIRSERCLDNNAVRTSTSTNDALGEIQTMLWWTTPSGGWHGTRLELMQCYMPHETNLSVGLKVLAEPPATIS